MTVCYVNLLGIRKSLANFFNLLRTINAENPMTNSIIGGKIIQCFLLLLSCYNLIHSGFCTICKINWSCLCITGIYVTDAVLFFLLACVLVFHNHTIQIIINGSTCHQTVLHSSVHRQFIDVIAFLLFRNKITVCHHIPQNIMRFLIHFLIIHIHVVRKLSLSSVYAKKGHWFLLHLTFCFLAIIYVIRQSCYLCRLFLAWSNSDKWFHNCHISFPLRLCL